jgi:anaerobic magnesium-protoporphyrin IX monomethyl ester cyclase
VSVTLVYPGISKLGFGSFGGPDIDASWIHHGICQLAACLRQAEIPVDLIDLRAVSGWEQYEDELRRRRPALLGVSLMTVDYGPGVEAVRRAKRVLPGVRTVVGGIHPTLRPQEMLEVEEIDHVVTGEGEYALVELAQTLLAGRSAARQLSGAVPDLDALPYEMREVFDLQVSMRHPLQPLRSPFISLITGRGCLYNCSFCQPAERAIFGRKVKRRSVGHVIGELQELRDKYRFASMLIDDDCLTEHPDWVMEFCDAYQSAGFRQKFFCQSRADIIVRREPMIRRMREAGLAGVFVGFETGTNRLLNLLRKGCKVEHNYKAARILKKLGINIWANIMLGIPTETREDALATFKMLDDLDPEFFSPSFFTPLPGSDLYEWCMERDLCLISDHASFRRNPSEAKIKGIDYAFLNEQLKRARARRRVKFFLNRAKWKVNRMIPSAPPALR